jgi:mono/diheme cytochrome c family protein
VLGATFGAVVACTQQESPPTVEISLEVRGANLVDEGGCNDCHTPKLMTAAGPELDQSRLLSGHRADAQWLPAAAGDIGRNQWGVMANNDLTAWAGPWGDG